MLNSALLKCRACAVKVAGCRQEWVNSYSQELTRWWRSEPWRLFLAFLAFPTFIQLGGDVFVVITMYIKQVR